MSRRTTERRFEIVQSATQDGRVDVVELAKRFGVSEVTIRVDLNDLSRRGLLHRTRGGALATSRILEELSIGQKQNFRSTVKFALAERAITYIDEGDTLILDSGSTTAEIARNLDHFENLHVLTNGLNVAQILAGHQGVEVILTGGTLRKKSHSFFGSHAEESISRYSIDKLFMGVDGYDLVDGITTHFEHEAILNRKMCAAARKIIVVTDSSKFNRTGLHKIRDFGKVDVVITDRGIPNNFERAFSESGVDVAIVDVEFE